MKKENYRPVLIRTVVELAMSFRGGSREFPAARLARLQVAEGEVDVRPTYCFRPFDAQRVASAYPVMIHIYRVGQKAELHGVAQPLPEAQLTRDELLEIQQIKREITFKEGGRGLVARDTDTGMYILPAINWAEKMGSEPVAGQKYMALLEEYPNKFIAHPIQSGVSQVEVQTTAIALADRSGMATMFHATNVMSADGLRWVNFRKVLGLSDAFTEREAKDAFKRESASCHPDKKASMTGPLAIRRQAMAENKMTCLKAARDLALDWLKGCPSILKSGERKGERCGKDRVSGTLHCSRHAVHADPDEALDEEHSLEVNKDVAQPNRV